MTINNLDSTVYIYHVIQTPNLESLLSVLFIFTYFRIRKSPYLSHIHHITREALHECNWPLLSALWSLLHMLIYDICQFVLDRLMEGSTNLKALSFGAFWWHMFCGLGIPVAFWVSHHFHAADLKSSPDRALLILWVCESHPSVLDLSFFHPYCILCKFPCFSHLLGGFKFLSCCCRPLSVPL